MKMSTIKKIAMIAGGATLLGMGFAFASPVTFQNVPIINNAGSPVVQIVLGSQSQPSDGVVAGNIAAAIGNLAYTSVPVTASVNTTQANKVLHVVGTASGYKLSNAQVWLNESSTIVSPGTYVFSSLIGSVLNGAVILNSPQNTKTLQAGNQYAYLESPNIDTSPASSPYYAQSYIPIETTVTPSNNGGGVQFTSFTTSSGSNMYDNIMQLSSQQVLGLISGWGGHGESTYLWLTGFPVFNQGSSGSPVNQFQALDIGGAYQATFSTPINSRTSSNTPQINVPIRLLGQNWTIVSEQAPTGSVTSSTAISGGKLSLASSLTQTVTINVGKNYSIGAWNIALNDLGQPNSNGTSSAAVAIYYNNILTNVSAIPPGKTVEFNVTGHTLYVNLNETFAGLYEYQKWAKFGLYTNEFNVTNGKSWNASIDPGWYVNLLWTNTTGGTKPDALQSIIVYNSTPVNLNVGQNFTFIQSPQAYKLTFLGQSLGSQGFDTVTLQSSSTGAIDYQNNPVATPSGVGNINNITEPTQTLTVTSQIPNAFSYAGQTGSSVVYDLTPYQLTESASVSPAPVTLTLSYSGVSGSQNVTKWISSTNPLFVTVKGYNSQGGSPISQQLSFSSPSGTNTTANNFYNVTSIQLSRSLPGTLSIIASSGATTLAQLNSIAPILLYQQSGKSYESTSTVVPGSVIYNQNNGQPSTAFDLTPTSASNGISGGVNQFYTFNATEQGVPADSTAIDGFAIGLDNNSAGVIASPMFQLNYSISTSAGSQGSHNNVTYQPTSRGSPINVQRGFVSEKGSKVNSTGSSLVSFNLAKSQDWLRFAIGTNSTTVNKNMQYGSYGIGQATNIPNVTIANVTATVTGGTKNYSVSGINNLTATPSVTSATQPVLLKNLSTAPLVVLDNQVNPNDNLILIGSSYVNVLSQSLQKQYNISITPTSQPISQAYGTSRILIAGYYANQTQQAGNNFIQALYAQASST